MMSRDNFYLFCIKTYVVTLYLNRLVETIQMRDHNMVSMRNNKNYHQIIPFYWRQTCFPSCLRRLVHVVLTGISFKVIIYIVLNIVCIKTYVHISDVRSNII